jgi:acetyltransferase-like isoleucine patch superfamily enzyme
MPVRFFGNFRATSKAPRSQGKGHKHVVRIPKPWRGAPEWLAAPDAKVDIRHPYFLLPTPTDALIVMGARASLDHAYIARPGGLAVIGDNGVLGGTGIAVTDNSTILIGENTIATAGAVLDARNGGAIITGPDGLWAAGLWMLTDDGHTIRDMKMGERINVFGGRIVVERHVWFSTSVQIMGDTRIGADTVIGFGSLVKGVLPPNSVCVGRPAKPVRTGIIWSQEDVP